MSGDDIIEFGEADDIACRSRRNRRLLISEQGEHLRYLHRRLRVRAQNRIAEIKRARGDFDDIDRAFILIEEGFENIGAERLAWYRLANQFLSVFIKAGIRF